MTHLLADGLGASSPAAIIAAVFSGVCVVLLSAAARSIVKMVFMVRKLYEAMFPEREDSLPKQLESVRDDLHDLRLRGSERLAELLAEARVTRHAVGAPPPRRTPPRPGSRAG